MLLAGMEIEMHVETIVGCVGPAIFTNQIAYHLSYTELGMTAPIRRDALTLLTTRPTFRKRFGPFTGPW